MKWLNKEILEELKKVSDKVWVSLKDLIFWNWENILILKNQANKDNIKKSISEDKIIMESKCENNLLKTIIKIPDNYKSKVPIHFCFILDQKWTKQAVQPTWYIWKNAKVKIFAYCFWLNYEIMHQDKKMYYLDEWASLEVYEFNYNMNSSYLTVYNTFTVHLADNAYFKNYYVSTVWHLWHGITNWKIYCKWKGSKAEFTAKSKILNKDVSDLEVVFYLEWEKSSWLMQSKSVTYEWWTNIFKWKIVWIWNDTKWHIECNEMSLGKCVISTSPSLKVKNPTSRLTHEASVWTLEKKAIENLMIKWFTEEQAVKFLISWILDSV